MKRIKIFTLLFSLFILTSCTQFVTIIDANKTMNVSGLPTGKNYIDYKLEILVNETINFVGLKINGENITKNLYLKDLKTGLSSTKIKKEITKGKYLFGFRNFETKNFKNKDVISLTFNAKEKVYTVEKEVKSNSNKINK